MCTECVYMSVHVQPLTRSGFCVEVRGQLLGVRLFLWFLGIKVRPAGLQSAPLPPEPSHWPGEQFYNIFFTEAVFLVVWLVLFLILPGTVTFERDKNGASVFRAGVELWHLPGPVWWPDPVLKPTVAQQHSPGCAVRPWHPSLHSLLSRFQPSPL